MARSVDAHRGGRVGEAVGRGRRAGAFIADLPLAARGPGDVARAGAYGRGGALRGRRGDRTRARRGGRGRRAPAGRWSRFRAAVVGDGEIAPGEREAEFVARQLLVRYGLVFRRLLERERIPIPWRDLARVLRRMELRGDVRGGRFVSRFAGEQYA